MGLSTTPIAVPVAVVTVKDAQATTEYILLLSVIGFVALLFYRKFRPELEALMNAQSNQLLSFFGTGNPDSLHFFRFPRIH